MKKNIETQIRTLSKNGDYTDLEEAEKILLEYLKKYPKDTEFWLLLLRIECNPGLDDADKITHYANHILSYEPSNPYALLFLSYADYYLRNSSDDKLYNRLCQAKTENREILALIELAKARYFRYRDVSKCENALKKSIEYYPYHVMHLQMLRELYLEQNKNELAQECLEYAAENVKILLKSREIENWDIDHSSLDSFLDQYFKGTMISDFIIQ